MVQVDTVVLDKEGHPVKGLKADDFTVDEDGVRQRIASSPSAFLSLRTLRQGRSFLRT